MRVELDHDAMVSRLVDILEGADDEAWQHGTFWYARAHSEAVRLACQNMVTIECAAGVIAALSPRLPWERNVAYAERLLRTGDAPVLGGNKAKARRIAAGGDPLSVLGGSKVRAFYADIVNPLATAVCVDRHAVDAALGVRGDDKSRKFLETPKHYEAVAAAYRAAAAHLGISPAQCQAIVWVTWRAEHARRAA